MEKAKTVDRIVNVFAISIMFIVITFTIARFPFGVELSDDAYAVAETYMVSKGALPFINNWSHMPGWTLLLAPFIKVYTILAGGTDGIFLFYKFLSFFVNCFTAFMVTWLYRKHVKNAVTLCLISMIYIGATGWDYVGTFRGDNLAIDLMAVGVALIIVFFVDKKSSMKYPFVSGILLALSVLSYPALMFLFAFFIIAIIVICYRKKTGYKSFLFFLIGAILAALVIILYLSINGGFINIFSGIKILLNDVAYFRIKNPGISKLRSYMKTVATQLFQIVKLSGIPFIVFLFIGLGNYIKWNKFIKWDSDNIFIKKPCIDSEKKFFSFKIVKLKQILLISIIIGICFYHIKLIMQYKKFNDADISLYAMSAEAFAVIFIYPFIKIKKEFCKYLMGFIWFPTLIWMFLTGIVSFATMVSRHALLKNASFLLGLFVIFAIEDVFIIHMKHNKEENEKKRFSKKYEREILKLIPVVVMIIISFTYLFNAYSYVYREEPISQLNTVVESGPYKGMRTTAIRANGIIELNKKIDEYIDKDDYVLAMDNDPFIYLMSEGHICTPSTWDMAFYSYNFDQPDLYYDYFKVTNTEPTKIIYFNYGRDEIMSIDVDYRFNEFVHNNYNLIYENRHIFEWNYCGKNIICELLIFCRK